MDSYSGQRHLQLIDIGVLSYMLLYSGSRRFCYIGLNYLNDTYNLPTASVLNSPVYLRPLIFRFPTEFLSVALHGHSALRGADGPGCRCRGR